MYKEQSLCEMVDTRADNKNGPFWSVSPWLAADKSQYAGVVDLEQMRTVRIKRVSNSTVLVRESVAGCT